MHPIRRTRNLTTIGDSVGVTLPIDEARERGLVDEDDEPRDGVEFELVETEDGRFGLVESESE